MKRNDYRWFGKLVQLFLHPSLTLLDGTPKTHSSIQIWCCELVSLPFAQHNVLPYLVLLTNWNKMQTSQHSSFSILWREKQNCHQKRHQIRHSVTSIVRSKVIKSLHPFSETCARLVSTKNHMNRLFKYRFSHLLYRGLIYFFSYKRNSFTGVYLQCWRGKEESYSSKLPKWRLTCSFS